MGKRKSKVDAGYDMEQRARKLISQGKKVYHYSAYWGTWSRILSYDGMRVTEVDLTPVNPTMPGVWGETKQCRVREHMTLPWRDDIMTENLPPEVIARMVTHMGEKVTLFLMQSEADKMFRGATASLMRDQ